jgi:hypothetical protein|tara:strand:+ start:1538 stop:2185 length:648 start_codon:yes stop_codon:yes gene_type:complete
MRSNNFINVLIIAFIYILIHSCSKTTYRKVSTIIDDDCIEINELFVIQNHDSIWELKTVEEEHLYYFPNFEEAEKTKFILEHYQTKYLCDCGDGSYTNSAGEENPNPGIMPYQLTFDNTGIGNMEMNSYNNPNEDCLPFNPEKLVARRSLNGDWYLIEKPGHSMFGFGKNKEACVKALGAIKKYGFNQSCFVGRANASFSYLKRYREDIDTLKSN